MKNNEIIDRLQWLNKFNEMKWNETHDRRAWHAMFWRSWQSGCSNAKQPQGHFQSQPHCSCRGCKQLFNCRNMPLTPQMDGTKVLLHFIFYTWDCFKNARFARASKTIALENIVIWNRMVNPYLGQHTCQVFFLRVSALAHATSELRVDFVGTHSVKNNHWGMAKGTKAQSFLQQHRYIQRCLNVS